MFVRFKYIPRVTPFPIAPATVTLNNRPYRGKGPSLKLPVRWIEYINKINSPKAARYLLKPRSGWVNAWADDGTPLSESLTMGGNIGEVVDAAPGFYRIHTLSPSDPLPDVGDRLLIHKFTCVDILGQIRLPGDGIEVFYPLLTKEDAWVPENQVTLFEDTLPEPIFPGGSVSLAGFAAVALAGAVIRQAPRDEANKLYKLYKSTEVWVTSQINGWAQIGYKQFVDEKFIRRI